MTAIKPKDPESSLPFRPLKILVIDAGGFVSFEAAMDIAATGNTAYFLPEVPIRKGGWHGVKLLPEASVSSEHLVDSIDKAVHSVEPDAVFLLSEKQLYLVWDANPGWLNLVHPAIDRKFRVHYQNKHKMTAFVSSLGIQVPETVELENDNEEKIASTIQQLGLPIIVKGLAGVGGSQVRKCETKEEVFNAVSELAEETGFYPALQEYIDGPTFHVVGLFDCGKHIRFWIAEKTELNPVVTGPSISLRSEYQEGLLNASRTLLKALEFTGFAASDFIRDSNGQFRFLEINPRIWGSYEFDRVLGINLFDCWCRQLRGEQLQESTTFRENRTWAKIPEYFIAEPKTLWSFLRRLFHPIAIKSWAWTSPPRLSHQLRKTFWYLRSIKKQARGK